jgi:hypothetical protein
MTTQKTTAATGSRAQVDGLFAHRSSGPSGGDHPAGEEERPATGAMSPHCGHPSDDE